MRKFIKDNIVNILILAVLAFIAFQLFTLNTNVTTISKRVDVIESNTDFVILRDLPTSGDVINVESVLDAILKCSARYVGLGSLKCP